VISTQRSLPRAVIFDFDGVIFLSEHLHVAAWEEVGQSIGCSLTHAELDGMIGLTDADCARDISRLWKGRLSPDEILAGKRAAYRRRMRSEARPVAGVLHWIKTVSAMLPCGVATSSTPGDVLPLIEQHGISDAFRTLRTVEDVKKPKPDPEIYRLVAKDLGADPSMCVVFEDSIPGTTAALAAGMCVVGVTTTYGVSKLPKVHHAIPDFMNLEFLRSITVGF